MKKRLNVFTSLSIVLSLGFLSACGLSSSSKSPETAATNSASASQAPAKEATISLYLAESLLASKTDDFVKKFEDSHPGIKVKAEVVPDGEIYSKLQVKITTGEVPDVYQINTGQSATALAKKEGYLYDLSNLASSKHLSESIRQASMVDGKLAALPIGVGVMGFLYNKKMLADVGFAAPPATWEDLMKAGEALKAKNKALLVYAAKWESSIANVFQWTFGNLAISDPEFKKAYMSDSVDFSNPKYRAALIEGYAKFKELNQFVLTGSFTNEYAVAQKSFVNGEAAMIMGGTWDAGTIRGLNKDLDFGFMNLPYAPESQNSYIFTPEDGLAVNAKSANLEAAKTFVDWLYSKETYAQVVETKKNFSAEPGVGTLDPAYADVPKWLDTGRVAPFANVGPMPGSVYIALGQSAQSYTFNKGDAEKNANQFIKEYEKTKNQ